MASLEYGREPLHSWREEVLEVAVRNQGARGAGRSKENEVGEAVVVGRGQNLKGHKLTDQMQRGTKKKKKYRDEVRLVFFYFSKF